MQPPPPVRPMSPMQQQPMQQQPLQQQPTTQQPMQTMAEGIDSFNDGVSSNLKAMTDLLKDMKESQGLQSEDVEALADKVEQIAERLSESEGKRRRRRKQKGRKDQSKFGRSLDGEFHQKIKDVIDEFDANQRDDEDEVPEYYKNKITGLESKIDRLGDALELILSNRRLEDMDEEMLAENSGRYDRPIPPPPPPQMPQDEMMDQQFPPQFEPPPEMMDDPYFDDGTRYYDNIERDAAYSRGMSPGSATSVRHSRPDNSANESSGGFHYKGANNSFISAFSKMDNEKRQMFRPWMDDRRRRNDQLPRGVNPEQSQRPPSMGRGFNNVPMPPPGGILEDDYVFFEEPFDEFGDDMDMMFGY